MRGCACLNKNVVRVPKGVIFSVDGHDVTPAAFEKRCGICGKLCEKKRTERIIPRCDCGPATASTQRGREVSKAEWVRAQVRVPAGSVHVIEEAVDGA